MFILTPWRDLFVVGLAGWSYGLIAACIALLALAASHWLEWELMQWLARRK